MRSVQSVEKQSKKLDFKLWNCSTYDNINGYNEYYLLTDYNNIFLFKTSCYDIMLSKLNEYIKSKGDEK